MIYILWLLMFSVCGGFGASLICWLDGNFSTTLFLLIACATSVSGFLIATGIDEMERSL